MVEKVPATYHEVFAVNVNWNSDNRKWNLNANQLDDDRWNAGKRVFSRNLSISSASI